MEKMTKNVEDEITSLTENLHDDYDIVELEDRLETDPVALGFLLGVLGDDPESDMLRCKRCQSACNNNDEG